MKIWIDILTPKQLLFFEPIVKKLRKKHTVICTGRRYRELSNLVKLQEFELVSVGKHGGKRKESKLKSSIYRMAKLQKLIEKQRPDLTISFCSPDAARIAHGLGIKHIGFTDTPYAIAAIKLSVPLLQKLLIPRIIAKSGFTKFGISSENIIKYNAIDAACIVRQKIKENSKLPFEKNKKVILFRVDEEQASYVKYKNKTVDIIKELAQGTIDAQIVILARYKEQISYLKKRFGDKVKVLTKSYNGKNLLLNSDLFIGSGGTMTAESALLGIPTLSYNAVPNIVEQFLINKKIAKRESDPKKISKLAKKMLDGRKDQYADRSKKIMQQMQDPYVVLEKVIKQLMK